MIIFYNGFNLLIDLVLVGTVFYFTHKRAWWAGYMANMHDISEGLVYLDPEVIEKLTSRYPQDKGEQNDRIN